MKKSDRDKHLERMNKIKQKRQKKEVGSNGVSQTSPSLEPLEDGFSGEKLRIVRLSNVPRESDIGTVAKVLEDMGKPPEWADLAHRSKGKVRLEVYQGYFRDEANGIAQDLIEAGAKLVRC